MDQVDTGAIVALIDRTERCHTSAATALAALVGQIVTCEAVIDELKTGDILTLDADFRIYRWGANKPFRLLIEC